MYGRLSITCPENFQFFVQLYYTERGRGRGWGGGELLREIITPKQRIVTLYISVKCTYIHITSTDTNSRYPKPRERERKEERDCAHKPLSTHPVPCTSHQYTTANTRSRYHGISQWRVCSHSFLGENF